MKIKNKGKVHPSPSSSLSSPNEDALSLLKFLPATILALVSALSLSDQEVLVYMITRSMKTTTTNPSSSNVQDSKKKCKKPSSTATHKPPLFHCDCFDCYTCYWFRWDSSPNRELIHQAIEAFEDHLTHGEQSKKNSGRGKKKEKLSRRVANVSEMPPPEIKTEEKPETFLPEHEHSSVVTSLKDDVSPMDSSEKSEGIEEEEMREGVNEEMPETALLASEASNHKGLARKVLPDVLGLLNSRLWSLWSPNV